jgi:alkylation response protein AidB-like acyl-CoA dehydrogenase
MRTCLQAFDDTWTYGLFEGTSEIQRLVISRANGGMA